MNMDDQFDSEFIEVGRGIAGLRAAVDLAEAGRVLILTKAEIADSNSAYAQGGIAAAEAKKSPQLALRGKVGWWRKFTNRQKVTRICRIYTGNCSGIPTLLHFCSVPY